jgi:uncharacterized membrane protein (UPF0182 family)
LRITHETSGIEPYFLLTHLPDQTANTPLTPGIADPAPSQGAEFILSVPFTPVGRETNLSGWLAGRSDGEHYGQLALYRIPDSRNVSAPQQFRSRINTEKSLSQQLTLWDSPGRGSRVLWGNLLVIPIGRGLMYVQPIFLQSERSPIPELGLVVLATQDKLVHAPTYEEALQKLLGESAQRSQTRTVAIPPNGMSTPVVVSRRQLIERAARELSDYQTLTSQGKYGEAGQKLEALKKTLGELQQNP